MERSNWKKVFSNSKQRYYWFNQATGKTQWEEPAGHKDEATTTITNANASTSNEKVVDHCDKKRKRDDAQPAMTYHSTNAAVRLPKVAIIVPFRDLHPVQKRAEHLARFIPEMARYAYAHYFY
jgi:hypothetical protein